MSAYSSLDLFYELDERRRRSRELDFGTWWRWQNEQFRVTWVDDTGELIAVRLTPARVRGFGSVTHGLHGVGVFAGEPMGVYVLAIVETEELVERLLDGWANVCGQPASLGWVAERAAAPPLHEVLG